MLHRQAAFAKARGKLSRFAHGVPLLMYHQVSDTVAPAFRTYTVRPGDFARQMAIVRRLGFTSVSMDDLLEARAGMRTIPRRSVVITFDDGFRDCLRYAAPVLHANGLSATMYVVAGLLGGTSRWMARDGVDLPLVTAGELRELEDAGVRCESHALTHARLATLEGAGIGRELRVSKEVLEDVLGRPVRHLAYPHGSYDARVQREAAATGYVSASTTRPGKSMPGDDVMTLPRVKVDGRDRTADFVARLLTSKDTGLVLRRLTGKARPGGDVLPTKRVIGPGRIDGR
jgi:peptidoglycan/xylan/chitin deacetylase (PgdA/CDA1 family)